MSNLVPVALQNQIQELRERFRNVLSSWMPRNMGHSVGLTSDRDFWTPIYSFAEFPQVDVEETEDAIQVRVELPGLEREDFSVEAYQDRLVVRGEKKLKREKKESGFHQVECKYGSFTRVLPLPCETIAEKAEAEYRNGVLRVDLPKTNECKKKRIAVKVS